MKKTTIVLLCSAVIVIFTVLVSVVCFKLYNQEDRRVSSVEISLNDQGKGVMLDKVIPIQDYEVDKFKGYDFQVKNNGDVDTMYQVLIEEVELSNKKGYSKSELLSRNQLNYELRLNGKVIAGGSMADIKDNIIDKRMVPVTKTNKYKLKVWIPQSAGKTNWSNKYYRYKVNIKTVTEED